MAQPKIQSNQLTSTGVTPGSYTSANITVTADGRITVAASGTAAVIYTAGNLINPTLLATNEIAVRDVGVSPVGGNDNIFIGPGAGLNFTTGTGNVVIGALAGDTATQGSNNVLIGIEAGHGITTGTNNILIGYQAGRQQVINGDGSLSDQFIINNENVRDPALYSAYLRGRIVGDNSTLQLAGSFFVKADDVDETIHFGLLNTGELELDGDPGVAGQVLTSNGPGLPVSWAEAGGGSPAGADREVQFNDAGAFGGDSNLIYGIDSSLNLLTGPLLLGDSSGTHEPLWIDQTQIYVGDAHSGNNGLEFNIYGGYSDASGGNIIISGGEGFNNGGNVRLVAGNSSNLRGSVILQGTNFTLDISTDFKINDNAGTAGQVLTSNGAGAAPTWQAGGGGVGVPGGTDTQIQFNNAGAFGGDARFSWEAVGGGNLKLGVPGSFAMITTPDGIGSDITNLLIIAGAAGPASSIASSLTLQGGLASSGVAAGGNVTIETVNVADSTGAAGNILIRGGVGGTDAPGGSISILGGAHGGFSSGNSGSVIIRGGRNAGTGNTGNVILGGVSNLALATNATGGFVTIPSCAGVPTGVPAPAIPTGQVPLIFDTTNNRLYAYDAGWLNMSSVTPGGADTYVQFNDVGVLNGDAMFRWVKGTTTIHLGSPVNPPTIKGADATGASAGTAFTVRGGDGFGPSGNGGAMTVAAGSGVGTGHGGTLTLRGGTPGSGVRGNVNVGGGGALATGATGGFITIPNMPGAPSGTIFDVVSGQSAMVFDSTNNKLYIRNLSNAAWVDVGGGGTPITANQIAFGNAGGTGITSKANLTTTAGDTLTIGGSGRISIPSGNVGNPSYTFGADQTTGMYFLATSTLAFSTAGVQRANLTSTGLGVIGTVLTSDGSQVSPGHSFTSEPGLGMFRSTTSTLGFAAGGAQQVLLSNAFLQTNVQIRAIMGSSTAPSYSFNSVTGMGMYYIDTSTLAFAIQGAEKLRWTSAGQIGLGGANYGTSGQVLTSGGSGAASWTTPAPSAVQAVVQTAASDETTALTTGTAKVTFRMPHAMTLTSVRASLTTAQTSGSIFTVDIKQNGTSIMTTTKITIDNTEKTSTTAVALPVLTTTALTDDSEITVDITQIGDGTAKGLKITLIGTR